MTDAAGTRSIAYKAPEGSEGDWTMREAGLPRRGERPMGWARINRYGEAETDELSAGSMTHTITEQRDELGRSTGYVYAKNDIPQQQTDIGYGADGRIASAGFTHQGEHKEFLYSYLPGTHLLHTLTHPNGLTLTQSYDNDRDLPTDMSYSRADALVVQRVYTYTPYGEVSPAHAYDQPLRWSSEYHDVELGLVYYNYRHYNPAMGRWCNDDPVDCICNDNLYSFCRNFQFFHYDSLGKFYLKTDPNIDVKERFPWRNIDNPDEIAYSDTAFPKGVCIARKSNDGTYYLHTEDVSYKPEIIYYRYSPTLINEGLLTPERRDENGVTTKAHELNHIRIAIQEWNEFVTAASLYDIKYCRFDMANKSAGMVNLLKTRYSLENNIKQIDFDIDVFSPRKRK